MKINRAIPSVRLALLLLGCACGTASRGMDDSALGAETLPATIRVPSGASPLAHFHAVGSQVYICSASAHGAPAWTLKAPDAKLFDAKGRKVGTHSDGPTWTSNDGSTVRGRKIAQADAPQADAIPWLLLQATAREGNGVFSKVEFIQRVNTTRGKAPASSCDAASVGVEARADYSADYYFYGAAE